MLIAILILHALAALASAVRELPPPPSPSRRDICGPCGYSRIGIEDRPCPECGAPSTAIGPHTPKPGSIFPKLTFDFATPYRWTFACIMPWVAAGIQLLTIYIAYRPFLGSRAVDFAVIDATPSSIVLATLMPTIMFGPVWGRLSNRSLAAITIALAVAVAVSTYSPARSHLPISRALEAQPIWVFAFTMVLYGIAAFTLRKHPIAASDSTRNQPPAPTYPPAP